jgi:hypothetical protein
MPHPTPLSRSIKPIGHVPVTTVEQACEYMLAPSDKDALLTHWQHAPQDAGPSLERLDEHQPAARRGQRPPDRGQRQGHDLTDDYRDGFVDSPGIETVAPRRAARQPQRRSPLRQ